MRRQVEPDLADLGLGHEDARAVGLDLERDVLALELGGDLARIAGIEIGIQQLHGRAGQPRRHEDEEGDHADHHSAHDRQAHDPQIPENLYD